MLGCGKDKAVRLFKELDKSGGIGLIERRKQGQGKPARIYVKNFTLPCRRPGCGRGAGGWIDSSVSLNSVLFLSVLFAADFPQS